MNVFHILGYLAPQCGGPPAYSINLGRAMQKHGISPSWWATVTPEEKQELAYLGAQAHLFEPGFPYFWYRSARLRQSLAKSIKQADMPHLHQVWDYLLCAASQLAQKHNKPYVVSPHGTFTQRWRYGSLKKKNLSSFDSPSVSEQSFLCLRCRARGSLTINSSILSLIAWVLSLGSMDIIF